VFDLFSKRQKALRGEVSDVYTYDVIPGALRVQIIHILHGALGSARQYHDEHLRAGQAYDFIVATLCREYGVFTLPGSDPYEYRDYVRGRERNCLKELREFILHEPAVDRVLDAVELSFRWIDKLTRGVDHLHLQNGDKIADDALAEL